MNGKPTHTDSAFELRERLSSLLAQADALVVVADLDGLDLRDDLRHGYMQALHGIVVEARAVAEKLTTGGGA